MAFGNHLGAHNDVGSTVMYLFKEAFGIRTFLTGVCIDSKDFCIWPLGLYVIFHLLGALPNGAELCVAAFWAKWWNLFDESAMVAVQYCFFTEDTGLMHHHIGGAFAAAR